MKHLTLPLNSHSSDRRSLLVRRRRTTWFPSRVILQHFPPDGKLRVYRSKTGGNEWEALTKGLPQHAATSNSCAMRWRSTRSIPAVSFGTTGGQVYGSRSRRQLDADRPGSTGGAFCRGASTAVTAAENGIVSPAQFPARRDAPYPSFVLDSRETCLVRWPMKYEIRATLLRARTQRTTSREVKS